MSKRNKKNKSGKKLVIILLIVILVFILTAAAAVYCIWKSYYDKSNYVNDNEFVVIKDIPEEEEEESESAVEMDPNVEVQIKEAAADYDMQSEDSVYNILIIGSDRRDSSWYGNSDSMILMSVNTASKKIHMVSFMRDLYASIPGIGVKKLNAAYAHGAGPLLVQTIEDNFKVDINNYASVDFDSLTSIIDSIGGIDMEIYQAEADYLNKTLGTSYGEGTVHMGGKEALTYARIRYVGKYDFERTSRQRRVLEKIIGKVRGLSLNQMNSFVSAVLPYVTHNIPELELVSLISKVPEWISYDIVQDRIPYDGMYSYMGEMLVPDYRQTIPRLHETLYGSN